MLDAEAPRSSLLNSALENLQQESTDQLDVVFGGHFEDTLLEEKSTHKLTNF